MSCPPCTFCGYVKYSYQLRAYDAQKNKTLYICNDKCFEIYKKIRDVIIQTTTEADLKIDADKPIEKPMEIPKSPQIRSLLTKRLFSELNL